MAESDAEVHYKEILRTVVGQDRRSLYSSGSLLAGGSEDRIPVEAKFSGRV